MSKEIPGLHPRMPFYEAARPAITAKLDDMFKHLEGTRLGEDIEELHDMRVASRRLREVLDIFAVCFPPRLFKPLWKTAAFVTRSLGEVRDRDVLLEGLARYRDQVPDAERPGVEDLMTALRDERTAFREQMLAALDEVERRGFRRDLEALLGTDLQTPRKHGGLRSDASLRENAQRICVVRVADFYGLAPAVHDPERIEELHEMRKAAKHLRYALEIFNGCFGKDMEARIEEVKAVQDQIGKIHDCDVLVDLVRRQLSVVAQRTHEALSAIAVEAIPHQERLARIQSSLASESTTGPRFGLLSLLGSKMDERRTRYRDFVQWWDEHERDGLRGKLYASITAYQGSEDDT